MCALMISLCFSGLLTSQNSVLQEGDWYGLTTSKTGIYRITYSDLQSFGIDPAMVNPKTIRIFGNGNGMLPEPVFEPRYDELQENAIQVFGEDDLTFDPGDYILFFGQKSVKVMFDGELQRLVHETNLYTDHTCYFLNFNQQEGKRIALQQEPPENQNIEVNTYNEIFFHEMETVNLLHSGKTWYGEETASGSTTGFEVGLQGIVNNDEVFIDFCGAGRSLVSAIISVYANADILMASSVSAVGGSASTLYARNVCDTATIIAPSENFMLNFVFESADDSASFWLDYFRINYLKHLNFNEGQMIFRNPESAGQGNVTRYTIADANTGLSVWDITDPANIFECQGSATGGEFVFKAYSDNLREYIAFDGSGYLIPGFSGSIDNQNLHAADAPDLLIITTGDFVGQAGQLAAFHQSQDNMTTLTVTTRQIYNEFSSGVQDVTAIRDFIRHLYNKSGNEKPGYIILFGDASYDYKENPENYVPVWESPESLHGINSICSDDFFGFLDDEYTGGTPAGALDVSIGRLPAKSFSEAQAMVDKIILYNSSDAFGSWRNDLLLIADDGDMNLHLEDGEQISSLIYGYKPGMNRSKVWFDLYTRVSGPEGYSYPEVHDKIIQNVNKGCLFAFYSGHGSVDNWGAEHVFGTEDIQGLSNPNSLPVFVTGTSYFGLYDDPAVVSGSELLLSHNNGGAIAVISQARATYAGANFSINEKLMEALTSGYTRLGDALLYAKPQPNFNGMVVTLLGDPALLLSYPDNSVLTTEINGVPASFFTDTISPGENICIKGTIADGQGNTQYGFNGELQVTVFERPFYRTTLANDPNSQPVDIEISDSLLMTVETTVNSGAFEFQFSLPVNISPDFGKIRLSYYGQSADNDATGFFNGIMADGNPSAVIEFPPRKDAIMVNQTITSDKIFIQINRDIEGLTLNLIDSGGRQVISREISVASEGAMHELSLAGLQQGMYILNACFGSERISVKIMKQ